MQRVDILLVEQGLASTRTQAQRLLKEGRVSYQEIAGAKALAVTKPGLKLPSDTVLTVQADESDQFVSRGALKLKGALTQFGIDVTGKIALDIGQSTGGFTDVLVQSGIKRVVGIEVGHDQLSPTLRNHPAVICYEGMNARALPEQLREHASPEGFDLAVMDVSFISQTKILPSLVPLLKSGGTLISLVKPQFEVGKEGIGKGGIVRDERLFHSTEQLIRTCCDELNITIHGYMESPIKGGDGNREFLLWGEKR